MAATAFDTAPNPSRRQFPPRSAVAAARHSDCSGIPSTAETAAIAAPLQPLDSGIVSDVIPQFFIGRNKDGFWVARDAKGKSGGLFLFENSALSFARRSSPPGGCATIYPSEPFELDLDNMGNPLVAQLGSFKRLAMFARQRMAVAANAHSAKMKRLWIGALVVLAAGGALAAIIALKAALFVWVFHYS